MQFEGKIRMKIIHTQSKELKFQLRCIMEPLWSEPLGMDFWTALVSVALEMIVLEIAYISLGLGPPIELRPAL